MSAKVDVVKNLDAMAIAHGEKWGDIRDAVVELMNTSREYRKQYGWKGTSAQERSALRLDAALANIGPQS